MAPRDPRRPSIVPLALLALLLATGSAGAHADLVGTYPPGDAEVEHAPERLLLEFSEPLEDVFTRIHVLDVNGTQHAGPTRIEGSGRTQVVVDLPPLPDGYYLVMWRTLGTDAHPKEGRYLLAVNASLADAPPTRGLAASNYWGGAASVGEGHGGHNSVLRGFGYLALSLAWGLPLFGILAQRRRLSDLADVTQLAGIAAACAAGVAFLDVFVFAAAIETTLGGAMATTGGPRFAARVLLLAAAATLLLLATRAEAAPARRNLTGAGLAALAGAMVATALLSHAASGGAVLSLPVTMDLLHLLAAATWVGGVTALLVLLLRDADGGALAEPLVRFRPVALTAAAVAIVTGTYGAIVQVESPANLTTSGYGLAVVVKVLAVLALLALAALNAWRVAPAVAASPQDAGAAGRLRTRVGIEVAAMALVLLLAALLTGLDPP